MLNFDFVKKIHFIGVGGVSLSSLARFMYMKKLEVSGSDRVYSPVLENLSELGVRVWSGFEPSFIGKPDLVVYSSAVKNSDAELSYCRASGFTCLERYEFLPYVEAMFPCTIAVSGTHGKTTVTSMCAEVMKKAELAFYAHIGGDSVTLGNCYYSGDKYFLTEACEYRKSFLALSPFVAVVLNAEFDHPDTYASIEEVYDAFDAFLFKTRKGLRIVGGDTQYYRARQKKNNPITFGFGSENDYVISNVSGLENGCFGFRITHLGMPITDINLKVPGRHNIIDAAACVAVCDGISLPPEIIKKGLEEFRGVKRRFEYVGEFFSAKVYSDYAHHPSEIEAAIKTARLIAKNRVTVVFQPHTYSRTAALKSDFSKALSAADRLIVVREYAARETADEGTSALALFGECVNEDKTYCGNIVDAAACLTKKTAPGDVIVVLGAGDINNLCSLLIS
jgi:UDP-N-acetylmuramate--alanine ligase